MRTDIISSGALKTKDFRLDASYHASPGQHAAKKLVRSGKKLDRLDQVCLPEGVFIPSRFKRIFVDDSQYGAPYLTGRLIMRVEPLQGSKLLSYRFTANLDKLALTEGMILITCSGEIGNTVFVNAIFDGAVGSPDLIRVFADPQKIASGYLYAYLSSSIARELIRQKTYGAVIPHIESHHVVDLPIPRLEEPQEILINQLIEKAASLRVQANHTIKEARRQVEQEVGFSSYSKKHDHAYTVDSARIDTNQPYRLDSFYYSGYSAEALRSMAKYSGEIVRATDVGFSFYNPPLFKRMFAQYGYPYMSGVDFYNLRPTTDRYLSKNQPDIDLYLVRRGTILMQNAGQRYGLITTPIMVTKYLDGVAVTSDVIRIKHPDLVENGYICALFGSGFGRRLALRYSYGTSIPRLDVPEFSRIKIPWLEKKVRRAIGDAVVLAYEDYEHANELEDQAQAILALSLGLEHVN